MGAKGKPRRRASSAAAVQTVAASPASPSTAQAAIKPRRAASVCILAVERNASVADMLRPHLCDMPFAEVKLQSAATLKDALARLEGGAFDLVIADLDLPDSSGIATLQALAAHRHSGFVVATAEDDPKLRAAVQSCNACEFLPKGELTRDELRRLVRLAAAQARTLASLRESEARFRALTALSSDMHWEQDAQFRFTAVSDKSPHWLRQGQQALLGKRRWDQQYFNMSEDDWAAHRAILEAHVPFRDLELGRRNEAGEAVWVSTSGEPVFDEAGRFKGYRGIGKDITARKREERILQLEHAVTRCLSEADSLSAALTAVIRCACEAQDWECGRYFAWNESIGALTFAQSWTLPRPELDTFIERSRRLTYAEGAGLIGEAYRSGRPLWVSDLAKDKRVQAGIARDAGMHGAFLFPAMADGKALGVFVFHSRVVRDPDKRLLEAVRVIGSQIGQFLQRKHAESQRLEIETRFRQTFELAGSGIAHVDLDGRFLRTNRKLCQILGYTAEELVGRSVKDISHPGDRDVTDAHRARIKAGELDSMHIEKRYLRKDGGVVWVDLTVALARDENGKPHYEISVLEDITDRKRAEQLQNMEHRATRCLADSDSVSEALRGVMQAICESEGSDVARYFELDAPAKLMRLRESWSTDDPGARQYGEASRSFAYGRGEGTIGAAWERGEPIWIPDMTCDPRVANPQLAVHTGMRAAFNFPVAFEGATIGIISITSREARQPDAPLLQTLRVIGSQLGQFLLRKRSEDAQRRFRAALDASADMVFLVDMRDARFLDFNAAACRYLGYERDEMLGCPADKVVCATSVDKLLQNYGELLKYEARADSGLRTYRRKDGSTFEAEALRRVVDSPEGPILVINARDLTERRAAENRHSAYLRYQEKVARLGQSALGMRQPAELIADAAQCALEGLAADAIAYVEAGPGARAVVARAVLGLAQGGGAGMAHYQDGDPLGRTLERGETVLLDEAPQAALPFAWARGMRSAALLPVGGEPTARGAFCALSRQPGAFGPQEMSFIEAAASVLSAGLQRIETEGRLSYLAQFDGLTGLPNRTLLSDRFSQMITQARRRDGLIGVLFIDLDDFKLVNDTLGHAGGDELLKEVARRLQASVRSGDTVARISGDEFAVILGDLARPEDAAVVAQNIIERLSTPAEVAGREVVATASIGIAGFPGDGADAEALIGAADAAMYRAKQAGRNAYHFFTAEINQKSRARAQLAAELRRALERNEFALVYQPKFDLASGAACGAEALLRWRHPERGVVSPGEFIPVLEEIGLIVRVGEWVLSQACADLKAWAAAGLRPLPVAVNLSARQFRQTDLDERICALVRSARIDPALIELEITESQLMHDPDHAIRVMQSLRDSGIRSAIDDFGTGYSSLAYLSRFPVASLKIDRSFVAQVNTDPNDATIVRTIIEMAHSLGFIVVAEGVETEGQKSFLRLFGCEQAQGYLLARPMAPADFQTLLAARPPA